MTIDQEVQAWTLLKEAHEHDLTCCQAQHVVEEVADPATATNAYNEGLGAQMETILLATGDIATARHLLGW